MYGNVSTYIITFGLKSIHDIHDSYATSNMQFIIFVLPGVKPFMMPGVNFIYELISHNKIHLYFDLSN